MARARSAVPEFVDNAASDSGERPDILVEATAPPSSLEHIETLSVPIEIEGCWHKAVPTAQRDQLAQRYLDAKNTDAGIYLVGWYPPNLWTASDPEPKRLTT